MAITDRAICTEEGAFTYNGVAGGTFAAGDILEMNSDGKLLKGDGSKSFVGVAIYAAVDGDNVAYYGPSNKVWGNKSTDGGFVPEVGGYVKVGSDGGFAKWIYDAASNPGNIVGVCLEFDGTYCKVLLY